MIKRFLSDRLDQSLWMDVMRRRQISVAESQRQRILINVKEVSV
jgi:hypothetical protein